MDVLQGMRVFMAVSDTGGFTSAAQQLNMSVPSVTRVVAQLEAYLGTRLLQRTTRRVSLTPAGEEYARNIQPILQAVEHAHAAVLGDTTQYRGTLRIGCQPSLAEYWIAPLYAKFRAAYPLIDLDVYVDAYPVASLGSYDIALVSAREGEDSNLVARQLFASDGILCAAPSYLVQQGTPHEPADLLRHQCLLRRSTQLRSGTLQLWRQGRKLHQAPDFEDHLRASLTINHTGSLLRMALDGAGIAAFSHDVVAEHIAQGHLAHVLPQWITGRFTVLAAVPSHRHLPARSQIFLDFLSAHGNDMQAQSMEVPI